MINRIALLLLTIVLFASCSNSPQHLKYIPKDASVVVGVNTAELGKKIAWDALWGSKLLEEMQQRMDKKDVMKDMGNSGIQAMTTYYLYLKTDKRFESGNRMTAVLPMDDIAKWEAYLKKVSPQAVVKAQKDRKEALISEGMYAGWTNDVLIIMNTIYPPMDDFYNQLANATPDNYDSLMTEMQKARKPDEALMTVEMDKAFNVSKDDAITAKVSFMNLEKEDHDITMWMNYETLMGDYMTASMTGGIALSGALWKDAAMAAGFDFEDGKIDGKLKYYVSEELKMIMKQFGTKNADKEMMERLPAEGLNLLAGLYVSPTGIKAMVDLMGLTGVMNAGLAESGMNTDDIFTAFSGDFALSLNNFKIISTTIPADSFYPGQKAFESQDADIQYTFAMKTGKKESFDKLLQLALKTGVMVPDESGKKFVLTSGRQTVNIAVDNGFVVVSNNSAYADGFMQSAYKSAKRPEKVAAIQGHPWGLYFDVKSMYTDVNTPGIEPKKKAMLEMSKNLLDDLTAYGGENKGNTFDYSISVSFTDKKENSLIQLLNYASKLAELNKEEQAVTVR
jgi:hypothetical protein